MADNQTEQILGNTAKAKAMREQYNAMRAKLAYEKENGQLIDIEEVKKIISAGDKIIKDSLEILPYVLADQLAAETTSEGIRRILTAYINETLNNISNNLIR